MQLPYFDPDDYSDERLAERFKRLLPYA